MTRIVAISDTHTLHDRINVPDGNILVHAGDFCGRGEVTDLRRFIDWFYRQRHAHKVFISGNHDVCMETMGVLQPLGGGLVYLQDASAIIAGLRFYGSPWTPRFFDWAFMLDRGEQIRQRWAAIPGDTDVLITHGPPRGVLDVNSQGEHCGCDDLLARVDEIAPMLHIFGHIHEGHGYVARGRTLHVNASTCTAAYRPTNAPIVIDVDDGVARVVEE